MLEDILKMQNKDGSWNETYPRINVRSTLATAYVGSNVLKATGSVKDELRARLRKSVIKAGDYVASKELAP